MPTLKEIVDRAWNTTWTVTDAARHVRVWLDAMAALGQPVIDDRASAALEAAADGPPPFKMPATPADEFDAILARAARTPPAEEVQAEEVAAPAEPGARTPSGRKKRRNDKSVAMAGRAWGEEERQFAAKLYDRDKRNFAEIGKSLGRTSKSVNSAFWRGVVPSNRWAAENQNRKAERTHTMNGTGAAIN